MSAKNSKLRNLFKRDAFSNNHTNDKQNTKGNVLNPQLPSLTLNHPDLIIVFSPEGDIVSQSNKGLKELFGDRLQTKNDLLNLFPEPTNERVDTIFSNALDGVAENMEVEVNKDNGQQIKLLLTFISIHKQNNNNVEGIYLIINDLTELPQQEQSLELMKYYLNYSQQIIVNRDITQESLFSELIALKKFEQMVQAGYLLPSKKKLIKIPEVEHREFYRIEFPYNVLGNMTIIEVNNRKLSLGSTQILIKNISLGGMKLISLLKLPIDSNMKFMFSFILMSELFELEGSLIWKDDAKEGMFVYGVKFNFSDEDRLAPLINRISVHLNTKQLIPNTEFIYENPILFLNKHLT